ncbi:MAG: AAA family ATPase, partial [Flavobacteriales bacterium]|nr:AAA family ATPase [Flavobacteriales bacterium]
KEFEKLSDFFWSIEKAALTPGAQHSLKEFFQLRERLESTNIHTKDTHYLLVLGETSLTQAHKVYFGSFQGEIKFISSILDKDLSELTPRNRKVVTSQWKTELAHTLEKIEWKKFLQELKNLYSYVYLPVELEVESFTKIETDEMQKIFDKKLKDEIKAALGNVNLDNSGGINRRLESFVDEIKVILNNEYYYGTGQVRYNNITQTDLVNKVLEVYFQKRILYKKENGIEKKVSELSAGEKRQALINLVYAFLKRDSGRDKMIIMGVDEPENSLHTSLCYDQFEKLKEVSKNNQILITTHWYGFLPIVSEGYAHFLRQANEKIHFETYDLFDYRAKIKKDVESSQNEIPHNFILKSTYDLVQAIFYSIRNTQPYNWLICEGESEKIYFEHFFAEEIVSSKLRILPMGGQKKVIRLYNYLEAPIKDEEDKDNLGKIYCLVDTDQTRCAEIGNGIPNLRIKRLSNEGKNSMTKLLSLQHSDTNHTDIEQSLNPSIFQEVVQSITTNEKYHVLHIQNENGNTDFINNLRNFDIKDFFSENEGRNKILFAKKYVEILSGSSDMPPPSWITEIKEFFKP